MSYKTIEYTVYDDKIMPNTLQSGGVAGDDNAVRVKFDLNNITLAADDKVRIEISNGVGGFNSSEHLTVTDSCVYFDLPYDVTSAGGTAVLHLVICSCKDNIEQSVRYSYPAKIYFEDSCCKSISYKQYKQGLSGLALECKTYSENAKAAADEAEKAVDEANQCATSAQSSQTAAQESAAAAKASADSAASAIGEHNTADDAHSSKFAAIGSQLSQMAPLAALSAAIGAHNVDTAAHEDIRDIISMLQKHPCYEYATSGGVIQRFDDVSVIPHNIGVTVHGATDENGNSVTNPTVSVYGKNLISFAYVKQSGFTVNGTHIDISSPTVFCMATKCELTLKPGTYTLSCTVSGNRTYSSDNRFRLNYKLAGVNNFLDLKSFESGKSTFKKTFSVSTDTLFKGDTIWFVETPTSADLSLDFQLEVGDTATDFADYIEPQTVTLPTALPEGQFAGIATFDAVTPTMTVIASDDNSLIEKVDITYNRDVGKAIAALNV